MYIVAIALFCIAIFALIIFLALGDSDALFGALVSVSGAVSVLTYRSRVWGEKKIVELELNGVFLIVILLLITLECLSFYLFVYADGENCLSKIDFFARWGKYFVLLIPVWIITLMYNLKK